MRSYNNRIPTWAKEKRLKRLKKMTRDGKKRNVSATSLQRTEGKYFHNYRWATELPKEEDQTWCIRFGTLLCWQEHQTIVVIETTSQIVWKLVKEQNCNPSTRGAEAGGRLWVPGHLSYSETQSQKSKKQTHTHKKKNTKKEIREGRGRKEKKSDKNYLKGRKNTRDCLGEGKLKRFIGFINKMCNWRCMIY